MNEPYVNNEYYTEEYKGSILPTNEILKELKKASRQVDSMTYNRINKVGVSNLTNFQLSIIKEVVCELADFNYENKDLINSILSSYSINGVNMSFDNSNNVANKNGVIIPNELYNHLEKTGLTCLDRKSVV